MDFIRQQRRNKIVVLRENRTSAKNSKTLKDKKTHRCSFYSFSRGFAPCHSLEDASHGTEVAGAV